MDSFVKAFYHLRMAEEWFGDMGRQSQKDSPIDQLCTGYIKRCRFMFDSFRQCPSMQGVDLSQFKKELNGDIMFHEEISSLCLKLPEEQKQSVVELLQSLLNGEKVTVVLQDGKN
jgi:hypothetical protein